MHIQLGMRAYITAYKENGQWNIGEEVKAIRLNDTYYLKTVADDLRCDNLGYLARH